MFAFDNCPVHEPRPRIAEKDFGAARREFLFFASGSQVQKGLDLLLEVFPRHPELRLHVCSSFHMEPDFVQSYRRELWETENVHAAGWIAVDSAEFDQLTQRCAYLAYPTCSDGQAGAVVQAMSAGLIPIATREAGIDTKDVGIEFPDDGLETIERVILDASNRPASWCRERAERTVKASRKAFSEAAFAARWRAILGDLEGLHGDRRHTA